jgi:hypothetical protein
MRELYDFLEDWKNTAQKNILSLSIQQENEKFCCILLADSQDIGQWQPTQYEDAMAKFQRKALKHVGVAVNFSSEFIKPEKLLAIQMKLEKCKTPMEVKAVFFEAYSTD